MRYVYLQKDLDVQNVVIKQLFRLTACRNLFLQVINFGTKYHLHILTFSLFFVLGKNENSVKYRMCFES